MQFELYCSWNFEYLNNRQYVNHKFSSIHLGKSLGRGKTPLIILLTVSLDGTVKGLSSCLLSNDEV